jgi:adenylate cyclase, class 2
MRNIEIKARIASIALAADNCQRVAAVFQKEFRQIDTYFIVPKGRFKLRICDPGNSYLVYYQRPDQSGPKVSDYFMADVSPATVEVLGAALGVLAQVKKTRTLYLWKNVRIHLDRVEGLGEFIEFEAVQSEGMNEVEEYGKVQYLLREFGVAEEALMASSYLDMVLKGGQQ